MPVDALKDLADYIEEKLGESVLDHTLARNELCLTVKREAIIHALQFLRDDKECRFQQLVDICGADYPDHIDEDGKIRRFEVVYQMLSLRNNQRLCVKVRCAEDEFVPSAVGVFKSAGWFEREVWDMYGIAFNNNPDLRRILTDYGFDGHPLRKDFPLTGYVELRYDEELKRVVYEPVQLTQDFRYFDYTSPWEAMTDVQLPGDEKGAIPPHGWMGEKKKTTSAGAKPVKKSK